MEKDLIDKLKMYDDFLKSGLKEIYEQLKEPVNSDINHTGYEGIIKKQNEAIENKGLSTSGIALKIAQMKLYEIFPELKK